jgi:hypothetical protein
MINDDALIKMLFLTLKTNEKLGSEEPETGLLYSAL